MRLRTVGILRSGKVAMLVTASAALPEAASAQAVPSREQVELPRPDRQGQRPRIRVESDRAIETAPCPLDRYDIKVDDHRQSPIPASAGAALAPEIQSLLGGAAAAAGRRSRRSRWCARSATEATAALRRAGYVASVQIPPQTVETGTLRLEVVTARIVEIRVSGDAAPYRDTIDRPCRAAEGARSAQRARRRAHPAARRRHSRPRRPARAAARRIRRRAK